MKAVYVRNVYIMLRRAALERMFADYPQLKHRESYSRANSAIGASKRYALFDNMIEPCAEVYRSEDYAFSRRWTDIGGEICVYIKSRLQHVGSFISDGDLSTQLTPITP